MGVNSVDKATFGHFISGVVAGLLLLPNHVYASFFLANGVHLGIELLEHNFQHAKYQLSPKTGKQHQLRVHLNHLNIPILNDPFYPTVVHKADDDFNHPLQLLAKEISFIDPISNLQRIFRSNHELTL